MWSKIKTYQWHISVLLLLIFNGAGIFGVLLSEDPISFLELTPLNLIISAVILYYNHTQWSKSQILVLISVAILGFLVEVLGVQTGKVFGAYFYEETLGWKLWDVSLIIGLNWALLTYFAVYTLSFKIQSVFLKAFLASILLVGLDILIEPIAIQYDFWEWESETIPIQNFIAWWFIALVFSLGIAYTQKESTNKIAPVLFLIQVLFFGILNFAQ